MSMSSMRVLTSATGSAALAIGLLALAPAPSADAETAAGTGTYACTTPLGQSFRLPASLTLSRLPETLTAGVAVGAGTPFTLSLDADALTTALGSTVLSGNYAVNQLSTGIGTTAVTNNVTDPLLSRLGSSLLGVGSTLGAFTPPSVDLPVPVPTSFDLVDTVAGVPIPASAVTCTLDPGASGSNGFGTLTAGDGQPVTVSKQHAKLRAHEVGHQLRLKVKVKNQTGAAAGKVVAKLKGKTVGKGTLRHGTVRLRLKHLPRTASRVRVVYRGDAVTAAAHKTVTVRPGHR